jgi:FkbM family methyltransferase
MSMLFLVHEIFVGCTYDFDPGRADPLIVDGGANLGMATLFFRLRFPAARVVAVEPHPEAFRLLEANTRGLGDGVERIQAALSAQPGEVWLHAQVGEAASLVSSLQAELPELTEGSAFRVAALGLSALLARLGRPVDLLKLDIEGAEYALLQSAAGEDGLAGVRAVVIEYHLTPEDPDGGEQLARLLEGCGFGEVTVVPGASGRDGIVRGRRPPGPGPEAGRG